MLEVLLKKTDYNTKITEIGNKLNSHDKYITVFNVKLTQANLVAKTNFGNTVSSLNNKIAANKTKNVSIENELKKLKTFDSSYFRSKSHFEEDGTQHYLVFQPINRYIKLIANNKLYISSWKSKGLSDETIKSPVASDSFDWLCWRQNKTKI